MIKRISCLLLLLLITIFNVESPNAKIIKRELTDEEYSKLLMFYPEKEIKDLSEKEIEKLLKLNIVSSNTYYQKDVYKNGVYQYSKNIKENEFNNSGNVNNACSISPLQNDVTAYETSFKKFTATLADNGDYLFTSYLIWKNVPRVRSYDVYAFKVNHFNFSNVAGSQVYYYGDVQGGQFSYYDTSPGYKQFSNGAGFSMNLKDGNDITDYTLSIRADLNITDLNYGRALLHTSYQHAKTDVTRAQSMGYTLHISGLGNTILFNDPAMEAKYDGMAGLELITNIPH